LQGSKQKFYRKLDLAGCGSFTTIHLNTHATSSMAVVKNFLPVRFEVCEGEGLTHVSLRRE
jgi:RNA 3'-terminal phosphate cyclase